MEGLRIHWPVVQASSTNVQMVDDFKNALCLGADGLNDSNDTSNDTSNSNQTYTVQKGRLSHLGVGLEWKGGDESSSFMSTNIIRGMPYATMEYHQTPATIYSYNGLSSNVQIDRESAFEPQTSSNSNSNTTTTTKPELVCGPKGTTVTVQSHLHLHMINSDFTWMVFFNKPVNVKCTNPNGASDSKLKDFKLSMVEVESEDIESENDSNLVVRVALLDQCTTGHSTIKQHCLKKNAQADKEGFERLLKSNAHAIPKSPTIDFEYSSLNDDDVDDSSSSSSSSDENESEVDVAKIHIDWDATSTTDSNVDDLLVFGLPHHLESLSGDGNTTITDYCVPSFHGKTCLVQSSKWTVEESLGAPLSFLAPRPPMADLIPSISEYLKEDISFQLSDNTLRGAADTYFSGKTVARLARIIVIATELQSLAEAPSVESIQQNYYGDNSMTTQMLEDSIKEASKVNLPSSKEIGSAIEQLKTAVTVWLKSNAEAPYIYDKSWGGLVNCGCHYVGKGDRGHCKNTFPDCPALGDVNEDFGNGM